jgi:amino acid transporter
MSNGTAGVVRALGRWDLILLNIVALVNINNVPPAAVYGKASLLLWLLAFAAFFLPEAVAVLALAKRYPGEGGIYLWIRRELGERHGFLAGWCYWVNNLFYVPVLLVYMAGILAFAGGAGGELVESRGFVAAVAFGWLGLIAVLNVRGLGVGKWIQNIGGIGTFLSIALVLIAAFVALTRGVAESPPLVANAGWGMAASFAVMCNAMVGIELASTMGDEIRNPDRDLRPAILIGGGVMLLAYLLVTAAVLGLVPVSELGVVQGIMQALQAGAAEAGLDWMVAPVALLLALSIGGAASAWFSGTARVPFVAGLTSALPAALGKVHPRWHSPYVALWTCAVLAAVFTAVSMLGSTVAEAYQVLLKAAVIIQLVPFLYLFLALAQLSGVGTASRVAGGVGFLTTAVGIVVAFLPTEDVVNVPAFAAKMALGVLGPIGVGLYLFRASDKSDRSVESVESDR